MIALSAGRGSLFRRADAFLELGLQVLELLPPFDPITPHERMMATLLAGIAEFEREPIREHIRFAIAAAKAGGKKLGRQPGQRPKSDRLAPKVLASSPRAAATVWSDVRSD